MKCTHTVVPFVVLLVVAFVASIVIGATAYLATSVGWALAAHQPPAREWASRAATEFALSRGYLDAYKRHTGKYPDTLRQLVPDYAPSTALIYYDTTPASEALNYIPSDDCSEYLLWRSCNHWVSSFDVLLYRSDMRYNSAVAECEYFEVDLCRYVIGGSSIIETQEREMRECVRPTKP